jgi:hypothetical protein
LTETGAGVHLTATDGSVARAIELYIHVFEDRHACEYLDTIIPMLLNEATRLMVINSAATPYSTTLLNLNSRMGMRVESRNGYTKKGLISISLLRTGFSSTPEFVTFSVSVVMTSRRLRNRVVKRIVYSKLIVLNESFLVECRML